MAKFEEMRIRSDKLSKYGEYTLGLITLNHIVSSINSLYLSKVSDNLKLPLLFSRKQYRASIII